MMFYACFSVSRKRNIRRSQNGTKSTKKLFLEGNPPDGLGPHVRRYGRCSRGCGARPPPWACPPASWGLRSSTDVLPAPIYTYIPPNYQIRSQNPNSTAVTFCIHEIPSWGLFRSSAGGGIDHGWLLHHHHSPSDEV